MVKIISSVHKKIVGKTNYIRAEIIVDSVTELPTEINGNVLIMGSIAWDVSTGDFYGLDSTGTWYKQDGSGALGAEQPTNNSLSASPDRGEIKSINIQPDIVKADIDNSEQPESVEEVNEPVEFAEEKESEGTGEEMQPIPEDEPLTEVKKDAVRNSENR